MSLTNEINQVLYDVGRKSISNVIQYKSARRYAHIFIQRVNIQEEEAKLQKRKIRTGMIKVLGLVHKRGKQSDPRITWFMFHKIYLMYSDIRNKKERNYEMILRSMS